MAEASPVTPKYAIIKWVGIFSDDVPSFTVLKCRPGEVFDVIVGFENSFIYDFTMDYRDAYILRPLLDKGCEMWCKVISQPEVAEHYQWCFILVQLQTQEMVEFFEENLSRFPRLDFKYVAQNPW